MREEECEREVEGERGKICERVVEGERGEDRERMETEETGKEGCNVFVSPFTSPGSPG